MIFEDRMELEHVIYLLQELSASPKDYRISTASPIIVLKERLGKALDSVAIEEKLHSVRRFASYQAQEILRALELLDVEHAGDLMDELPELEKTLMKVMIDELAPFLVPGQKKLREAKVRRAFLKRASDAIRVYSEKDKRMWEEAGKTLLARNPGKTSVLGLARRIVRHLKLSPVCCPFNQKA